MSAELRSHTRLLCHVGANPLAQSSILQIEWLKDGRRMAAQTSDNQSRIQIERANHLHMPALLLGGGETSGAAFDAGKSLRLHASSVLTIRSLQRSDSAAYSCQYKLIPTPATGGVGQQQSGAATGQHTTPRITSGQANQTIQLDVIEGEYCRLLCCVARSREPRIHISGNSISFCLLADS